MPSVGAHHILDPTKPLQTSAEANATHKVEILPNIQITPTIPTSSDMTILNSNINKNEIPPITAMFKVPTPRPTIYLIPTPLPRVNASSLSLVLQKAVEAEKTTSRDQISSTKAHIATHETTESNQHLGGGMIAASTGINAISGSTADKETIEIKEPTTNSNTSDALLELHTGLITGYQSTPSTKKQESNDQTKEGSRTTTDRMGFYSDTRSG